MIPLATSPLGKAIRTSEGQLVAAVSSVTALTAGFDPSTLPPREAAIVVAALAAVHTVSRTALKAVAVAQGAGLAPIAPVGETIAEKAVVEAKSIAAKAKADLEQLEAKVKALEEKPPVAELVSDAVELASPPPPVAPPAPAGPAPVAPPDPSAIAADLAARQQAAMLANQPIPTV